MPLASLHPAIHIRLLNSSVKSRVKVTASAHPWLEDTYEVTLDKSCPLGALREHITYTAKTESDAEPVNTAFVVAIADISGDIAATPHGVAFGAISTEQPVQQRITLLATDKATLQTLNISSNSPAISVHMSTDEARSLLVPEHNRLVMAQTLIIALDPAQVSGAFSAKVVVRLLNGQTLVLPVTAYIQHSKSSTMYEHSSISELSICSRRFIYSDDRSEQIQSIPGGTMYRLHNFSLVDINGKKRSLSDYHGHPIILFFFCGCDACEACAEGWAQLQQTHVLPQGTKQHPSPITLVIYSGSAEEAKGLAVKSGLNVSETLFLLDPDQRVTEIQYHAASCPHVFVARGSGEVCYSSNVQDLVSGPSRVPQMLAHAVTGLKGCYRLSQVSSQHAMKTTHKRHSKLRQHQHKRYHAHIQVTVCP
jgi:hypothetical protein